MRSLFQDPSAISHAIFQMAVSISVLLIKIKVLVAEIVKHFVPHIVELHNYSAAHSIS